MRFPYTRCAFLTVRCAFLTVGCAFLTVRFPYCAKFRITVEWPGTTPMMLSLFGRVRRTSQVPLKASPLYFIGYVIVHFPYTSVFDLGFFRGHNFLKIRVT